MTLTTWAFEFARYGAIRLRCVRKFWSPFVETDFLNTYSPFADLAAEAMEHAAEVRFRSTGL